MRRDDEGLTLVLAEGSDVIVAAMLTTVPVALEERDAARTVGVAGSEAGAVSELVGTGGAVTAAVAEDQWVERPEADGRNDGDPAAVGADDAEAPSESFALCVARPDAEAVRVVTAVPETAMDCDATELEGVNDASADFVADELKSDDIVARILAVAVSDGTGDTDDDGVLLAKGLALPHAVVVAVVKRDSDGAAVKDSLGERVAAPETVGAAECEEEAVAEAHTVDVVELDADPQVLLVLDGLDD
jgi:hypothetical protein